MQLKYQFKGDGVELVCPHCGRTFTYLKASFTALEAGAITARSDIDCPFCAKPVLKAGEPGENLDPQGTGEAAAPGPAGAAAAPAAGGFPPEALASLQRSEAYLLSIKKWVKFFGILTILALIGGLITLLALSDVF